jgi:hypothetical protein
VWAIIDIAVDTLSLVPHIEVSTERLRARTALLAQALWLFSYERRVTVDRSARRVTIGTRRLWAWSTTRVVRFDDIARIVYRCVAPPSADSALFLISLALRSEHVELPLFTVWEEQPREPDFLDRLDELATGAPADPGRIGDEAAGGVVALLREYIGAPVAAH